MNRSRNVKLIACSVFITVCSAVTAYYRAFVGLRFEDDEGALMMTVRQFLEGNTLYDGIASPYGPVYYFYQWCAHALTGLPVTHDSVRFVSIAFWVAAALMVFLLIYRATGSLALAAMTHFLAFQVLRFIGEEPAHPQEACIFLLMTLGLTYYAANPTLRMALLGALTGAMAATKINLGVFVVIALAVGFAFALRPGWLRTAAVIAASIGALILPVLLMWKHLAEPWAVKFCALLVISLGSAIMAVSHLEWDVHVKVRDLVVWGLCCGVAIGVICLFPLMHGSTIHGMLDALIVKPRRIFGQVWFFPAPVSYLALLCAVAGLTCAWYVGTNRARPSVIVMTKVAFAAAVMLAGASRPAALMGEIPFLWLVAVRPGKVHTSSDSLTRALLGLVGVAQALYVYPVAGSQVKFIAVFMIAIAGVCLWDAVCWVRATHPNWIVPWQLPRVGGAAQMAAGVAIAVAYLVSVLHAREPYEAAESLSLPGAERTRVEPQRAAAIRALAGLVNSSSCGILVTEPGLFSFNLWTGKPAPAGLIEVWMVFLSDAEEQSIVKEVSRDPHSCVIHRQAGIDKWTRGTDISSHPLVRFIRENFQTVFEIQGYRFMVRKP